MIDAVSVELHAARDRLLDRVQALRADLDAGHDVWTAYLAAVSALLSLDAHLAAQRGDVLLTDADLGKRFGISAKTAAKKARNGSLPGVTAVPLGRRGKGQSIRWRTT